MIAPLILVILSTLSQDPAAAQDPATAKDDQGPRLKSRVESVSSGRSNLLDRASATVSFLSGEDLRTLGVQTYTDALRLMPGLEVEKFSASESAISVRSYVGPGSATQGMLLLVDGRQAYNEFFGAPFWENIGVTMGEIKSIEVIRGPGSFLYGPNAMHGFVSITTMSPLDYDEGSFANHDTFMSIAGGSYAANQESITYIKREGNSGLKVTIAHDDMNQFDGGDTKNKIIASARFQSRISESHEVDILAGATKQKFDVLFPNTDLLAPATFTTRADEYYVQGKYTVETNLVLRASWTRLLADGEPDAVFIPFSLVLDTGDVELQYSISPIRSHHLTAGTGIRYSTFTTSDTDVSRGRHSTDLEWVFIQDEISILSDLFLTAGARLDNHSKAGTKLAPRLALVYEFSPPQTFLDNGVPTLDPGQSLRLTAGYGYRNPSLRELWFNMPADTKLPPPLDQATVIGNTSLDPERMRSFELGYWGRPTPRLQAEASIYYNLTDELVVFNAGPTPYGFGVFRSNVNKEDAYGLEANLEYQLTNEIFVFGNYAYELRHDRETGNRIPDGPLNKGNAGIRYVQSKSISGQLWLNAFGKTVITSKTPSPADPNVRNHLGETDAYVLLNAKIWYPFKIGSADGKAFVQAFNMLNHVHREHPDGDKYGAIAMAGMELAW